MIQFENIDCMEGMKQYSDKYFNLAITDPPYFDGPAKLGYYGEVKSNTGAKRRSYSTIASWGVPDESYFTELKRVSKNQIVWGINYYSINNLGSGRIVWDKMKNTECTFSDGEIAYCSLIETVRFFRYWWDGFLQSDMKNKEQKIHPTQKPVALYKWLLTNYARPGDKILDTHVGSASSLIACHDLGFDAVGFELDADYYRMAKQRLDDFIRQPRIESMTLDAREQMRLDAFIK